MLSKKDVWAALDAEIKWHEKDTGVSPTEIEQAFIRGLRQARFVVGKMRESE